MRRWGPLQKADYVVFEAFKKTHLLVFLSHNYRLLSRIEIIPLFVSFNKSDTRIVL